MILDTLHSDLYGNGLVWDISIWEFFLNNECARSFLELINEKPMETLVVRQRGVEKVTLYKNVKSM